MAASVLIVFSFQNASVDQDQWGQAVFVAPLVFGVVCFAALLMWEYYVHRRWQGEKAEALPMVLLQNRAYTAGVLNTLFTGFAYFICIYAFPIRFQVVNGKSALDAGIMLLPMLVAASFGSILGGFINRMKNMLFQSLLLASTVMLLGCALETTLSDGQDIEPKTLGFFVFIGLGFGLTASASTMLAIFESPLREHGKCCNHIFCSILSGHPADVAI
jgi:hypothetical protein